MSLEGDSADDVEMTAQEWADWNVAQMTFCVGGETESPQEPNKYSRPECVYETCPYGSRKFNECEQLHRCSHPGMPPTSSV